MPRASTSAQTLDTPGFRKSTPRRAAAQRATTNIASTSAQLLRDAAAWQERRTSKGKARADDNESQWEGDEATYGPQKGQVKRRQKRQSADEGERSSKRRKIGKAAPQLPIPSSTPIGDAARGDVRAAPAGREQLDPTTATSSPPKPVRKKRRKQVRIAQLAPLPTSDESSAYEPGSASEDEADEPDLGYPGSNAALGLAGPAAVDDDWADPLSIPTAQPVRGRRYWQALELGIVASAVHDVATHEAHLGRALVQWELLRQRRAAEEVDATLPRDDVRDGSVQENAGNSTFATPEPESLARQDDNDPDATPRPVKTRRRRASLPLHDPNRSLTPFPLSSLTADRLERDEDGVNLLPLPASTALAKMARWPVRKAGSPTPAGEAQMDALEEALLAQYERARPKEQVALPSPRERTRARNAYEVGGPLYESAQIPDGVLDDSDTESDGDSVNGSDELSDEAESLPPSLAEIPSALDRLLIRLLDFVPKAPSPASDYWMQRTRTEEMLKDDARAGFVRDRVAPGWEEVLAVAKEQELPADVLTKLEDQLIGLFGAPQRALSDGLPIAGSADRFVVRVQKQSRRRERDGAGKLDQAGQDEDEEDEDDGDDDDGDEDDAVSQSREPSAAALSAAVNSGALPSSSSQLLTPSDDRALRSTASPTPSLASGSDAGSATGTRLRPKRKYKPYVYSEEQRLRKAAYKRDLRRREREQREAARVETGPPATISPSLP